jgi:protein disulfide-isomerase-like protein
VDVLTLTSANFDQTQEGIWMILFQTPSCRQCEKISQPWKELAATTKGKINVATVDCHAEKEIDRSFQINTYPTIMLLREGSMYKFNMRRIVEDFRKFAETDYKRVQPKSIPKIVPLALQSDDDHEDGEGETPGKKSKEVIVLNDVNFERRTRTGNWFIEFFAPWCGYCKRLAPVWEELAKSADDSLNVAKVDCESHHDICNKHGVKGYPTIKLFTRGSSREYDGERQLGSFLNFYRETQATFGKKDEL